MAISTALWTTRLPALFIRRFLSSLSCPVSVFGMGKILGFSAKLVRLNFLFVEPFGRPGGRLVGVMYFCPQRGSYVGGSHAAGSKVQLSNNTKNLYGANPFSTNTAEYCCCGMPDSPPVLMRLGNANINDILLFNNRENPDIVSSLHGGMTHPSMRLSRPSRINVMN